MRPYKRKQCRNWRTGDNAGIIQSIFQYLKPFMYNLKVLWKLGPPFPVSGKIIITLLTWTILLLPLVYFLVPPLATIFLVNYFSGRCTYDEIFKKVGVVCASAVDGSKLRGKTVYMWKIFDKLAVIFFMYDYFQILRYFRDF
ncbi:UNVERIFIED_CONTAM: hypothetical protein PYX00_008406 [Menopon gallinae]|uniref:Uncharacterized protein n=1 Tax=Menopon gallinae TaxID=328185 RepID=A0AAW2HMV8_9NEOP